MQLIRYPINENETKFILYLEDEVRLVFLDDKKFLLLESGQEMTRKPVKCFKINLKKRDRRRKNKAIMSAAIASITERMINSTS